MPTIINLPLRKRRACDKCFSIKESCKWTGTRGVCDRCFRLNHFCESRRPRGKVGRRPRSDKNSAFFFQQSSSYGDESPGFSVPRNLSTVTYLNQSEKRLAYVVMEKSSFVSTLLLGPSFHLQFKQGVMTRLDSHPALLKDGFLAFYGGVALSEGLHLPGVSQEVNFERASSAVAAFRAKEHVNSRTELATFISLGIVCVAFAEWVTENRINFICQRVLSFAKPLYESSTYLEDHDLSSLSCLIFLESTECFFRGGIPTLRHRTVREGSVDRYLGLSLPLLPHLYDLCELSSNMAQASDPHTPAVMGALCRIEQEVEEWQPNTPPDFTKQFSEIEVVHVLAQAQLLSIGLLLIIHRLRFPFGVNDDKAMLLSKRIFREFSRKMVPFASFPFILAAAELADPEIREKVLTSFRQDPSQVKPVAEKITALLRFLWHMREGSEGISWLHLTKILSMKSAV